QALEAGGASRLRNESFFSAPQLKRDSLGGVRPQRKEPGMLHPIQRPAPASANLCPLRLCLRAILLLTLFVARLQAQGSASGANLGVAFPKDTIALETTFRLACSIG